jgi:hypothetical protein
VANGERSLDKVGEDATKANSAYRTDFKAQDHQEKNRLTLREGDA